VSNLPRFTSLSQLKPNKLDSRPVPCPEWGVEPLVWELTGAELEDWKAGNMTTRGGKVTKLNLSTATLRLLQKALKDEAGVHPLFSLADLQRLFKEYGAGPISRLEAVAMELSGQVMDDSGDGDSDSDEVISEAEGNSEPDPTSSSSTI
jgi:hypothetical protein